MKLRFNGDLYKSNCDDKKYYTEGEVIYLSDKIYALDTITKGLHDEILLHSSRADLVYNTIKESNYD